jgi:hypothetical protein
MENVIYEAIEIDDVICLDKKRFNTNNHWINDTPPSDYKSVINSGNTHTWIDKFNRQYIKIVIDDPAIITLLKELAWQGAILGKFSDLYEDELEIILDTYKYLDHLFQGKKYFVRDEHVSLKYGEHGIGPYDSFKMIIQSMTTTIPGHTMVNDKTVSITLYLMEWIEMNDDYEFRVFVKNNKITCISQQNCYKMIGFNSENIAPYIEIILNYFEHHIKNAIDVNDYSYDFAILEDMCPYFIELNSFGKEYAAGSSLFHWLIDEHKLYDSNNEHKIYVRYTK